MKRSMRTMFVLLAVVMSLVAVQAVWAEDFYTISIALSPETIVLSNKAEGNCGIHTDILYSSVDTDTLRLSLEDPEVLEPKEIGVDIAKSDSRGYLIVQISLKKVKGLILDLATPTTVTLTLSGYTKDGVLFSGSDIVRVEE